MTRAIVAFCMDGVGHLQVLLPVIEGLSARGQAVHVFSHADFRGDVERAGARFVDLFAGYPMETVDTTSIPMPSRSVSFAGAYAEGLAAEVAALAPAFILYDTYSVVAPVIARRLGVPARRQPRAHADLRVAGHRHDLQPLVRAPRPAERRARVDVPAERDPRLTRLRVPVAKE